VRRRCSASDGSRKSRRPPALALAAAGRKAEAITAAEQAVELAHPDEPRPKRALEALKK
jgi:hypothetical protein